MPWDLVLCLWVIIGTTYRLTRSDRNFEGMLVPAPDRASQMKEEKM